MKKSMYIILLVALLFGCGGGGGGSHSKPNPEAWHTPIIDEVNIYIWDGLDYVDIIRTDNEIYRGLDWYYDITVYDDDKDAYECVLKEYYPIEGTTPINSLTLLLPSQTSVSAFFYVDEDYTVPRTATIGTHRFDFQVEDRAGNHSAVFTKFVKVAVW